MEGDFNKVNVVYEFEGGFAIHVRYPDDETYRADSSCRRGVKMIHDNLSFEEADALFLRLNEGKERKSNERRQEPTRSNLSDLI
jgi:hypothetical protein